MTRRLLIALLLCSAPALAQTPTVNQWGSSSNTKNFPLTSQNYTYHYRFPQPVPAGNAIVCFGQTDSSQVATFSIADDQSNSYTKFSDTNYVAHSQKGAAFVATNVAANTRQVDLTVTTAASTHAISMACVDAYNVSTAAPSTAVDASSGNSGTSATATAGSITPTVTGDLLIQYVIQWTKGRTLTAGSQSNITWALRAVDNVDSQAIQTGVYNSTSAINSQLTFNSSSDFLSIVVALKAASAGSASPAGIRPQAITHVSLFSSGTGGPGWSSPTTMQMPASGNLLVAMVSAGGSGGGVVTGITDTNSNTWTTCGASFADSFHHLKVFYAKNPTVSGTLTLTVTSSSSTNSDQTVLLMDIVGADTASPCDASASASGNITVFAASVDTFVITPTQINELVLGETQHQFQTVDAISAPTGALLDNNNYLNEPVDGPENVDQNGGFAHFVNSTTSAETWTWHYISGSRAQGNWAAYGVSFLAAAGATPVINKRAKLEALDP